MTLATAMPQGKGVVQPKQMSEPIYNCSKGFNLVGKKCLRELQEPVSYACDFGYETAGLGKQMGCAKFVDMIAQCPDGTYNSGKGCASREFADMFETCPLEYTQMGKKCGRSVQLPLIPKCEYGQLIGKECVSLESAQLIVNSFCPHGYMDSGKGCARSEVYDCSPAPSKKGSMGGNLRFLGHKKHGGEVLRTSKKAVPAPKIQVVQKMCERTEFAKPIVESRCPDSFMNEGKNCVKRIVTAPIQVCSNGSGSKDCSLIQYAPAMRNCPVGYQMAGKNCAREIITDQIFYCPAGFVDVAGRCQAMTAPLRKCNNPRSRMQGDYCIIEEFGEPIVTYQVSCVGKGCESH